ncbi:protein-(glutamine-N5) methyltransferase, release factor-specific [Tumebacillus algifaecis]|uniref:Release factor glutamine methyltransferase n=1 Tax=Tumebacillus algifaecis TaxID=1214604 RepID=A0A223CX03_9BACL|nr:peptide chain release factor N(5)-glutamine methyltransferase [Tumebacillus algifaecis]ASS73832.1 protein-(glutamine-N5) methyltransferase, release factor-specific [Tumebacillus algifaecis]
MSHGTHETIREALLWASRFFEEKGVRSPQFNAEVLLQHVLGIDRTKMLVRLQDAFPVEAREAFASVVQKRGEQVPLQHLTGVQEFYGRPFFVSGDVLIPRPETELLIERILQEKGSIDAPLIVDIGTGSGAIALTLALEWPAAQVVTVDISPDALAMARRNAENLGVADRVEFLQGDLVTPLIERGLRPDIVVSNPPYIPTADCETLDVEVRDHEPRLALDGGEDGLYPYRVICSALPALWPEQGPALVAYEVGINQDQAVEQMIRAVLPVGETGIVPDWQGIGRVIWGKRGE